MATGSVEQRYSPFIILLLVAALVVVVGLWAMDRAGSMTQGGGAGAGPDRTGSETFEWKLVTTWPKNFPGLGSGPENFARYVNEMSEGRLSVRVYGAGEIVPAMEVFDAVSQGVADAGHGAAYYWKGKVPSSVFFTAVPFGLNAQEMNGWLHYGGGLALWQELYEPLLSSTLILPGEDMPMMDPYEMNQALGHCVDLIIDAGAGHDGITGLIGFENIAANAAAPTNRSKETMGE